MNKLEEIVAYKRIEVAEAKKSHSIAQLERALKERPQPRNFRQAIHRPGKLSLIAEVKRASPSAGAIRSGADAVEIAKQYHQAGAQALSVLTDAKFFSGSLADLTAVKKKVPLPVLRKDFLLEEYQILEAAAAGADALLLIVAILDRPTLKRLLALATDLGLDALVEVHAEPELTQALEAGAQILGINNRNLNTLEVDLKTTERLIRRLPKEGKVIVSESGIHSRSNVEFLERLGVHAVLIGEELMSAPDIGQRVRELMGWSS
jgi:indole-3-glycerol phosphate synthase